MVIIMPRKSWKNVQITHFLCWKSVRTMLFLCWKNAIYYNKSLNINYIYYKNKFYLMMFEKWHPAGIRSLFGQSPGGRPRDLPSDLSADVPE